MIFSKCDAKRHSPEVAGCALRPVAIPKNLCEVLMASGLLICQKLSHNSLLDTGSITDLRRINK
jgi:hypothetical protein